jgi:hypothetical protein
VVVTWRGARGAPKTPSNSLRSEDEEVPKLHSVSSGPSFNGDIASTGGLAGVDGYVPPMNRSSGGTYSFFLRRSKLDIGEVLLLLLAGDNPLIKSSLSEENKPCFLSIVTVTITWWSLCVCVEVEIAR